MNNLLIKETKKLAAACDAMTFTAPVTHIYNPLIYAWQAHEIYLSRFASGRKKAIFVGINPGPWGMGQTGIPFGDVVSIKDWLKITAPVSQPPVLHPKRPVMGFDCNRREVSGQRLWGFFSSLYANADHFFKDYLVLNYCPLLFINGEKGLAKNLTPDKIKKEETHPLYVACDHYMRCVIRCLLPSHVIGIGAFAEERMKTLCQSIDPNIRVAKIQHPSPANPASNKNYAGIVSEQLKTLGLIIKK